VLDFFFSRSGKNRIPLKVLKSDLHAHLLPGIDDGAKNDEETLNLIRGLQSLGYQRCIVTPHIYPGIYNNNQESIRRTTEHAEALLKQHEINFEIKAAAEYFFDERFFRLIEQHDLLTFGKSYVLFELPFTNHPPMVADIIFKLNLAGFQPVLAHPERYSFFHDRKMKEYEKLKNAGVMFQLNLMSLTGHYGDAPKHAARQLILQGMIDFAGTDLHREKQIKVLSAARETREYERLLSSGNLLNDTL
jgi:protein-tyrosine phosphatase